MITQAKVRQAPCAAPEGRKREMENTVKGNVWGKERFSFVGLFFLDLIFYEYLVQWAFGK